jgi:hypothetical protein
MDVLIDQIKANMRETQPRGSMPFDQYNFAEDVSSDAPDNSIQQFVQHYPYR